MGLEPHQILFQNFFSTNWPISYKHRWAIAKIFQLNNHNSKTPFFQDIKNSFHGVTQVALKPHQNF